MTATTLRMDRPTNQPVAGPKAARKWVAIGPVPNAGDLADLFRARGWEATVAATGKDARKLAIKNGASLVVLPARGEPETGWLGCLKLVRQGKKRRVILVGDLGDREAECFARYAGATAYLTPEDGLEAIWDAGTANHPVAISSV
jgi:hypothetical protein